MRIKNPWGWKPEGPTGMPMPEINNFIQIDPVLRVYTKGKAVADKKDFQDMGVGTPTFLPQSVKVEWAATDKIEVEVVVKLDVIAHVDMKSYDAKGECTFKRVWKVHYDGEKPRFATLASESADIDKVLRNNMTFDIAFPTWDPDQSDENPVLVGNLQIVAEYDDGGTSLPLPEAVTEWLPDAELRLFRDRAKERLEVRLATYLVSELKPAPPKPKPEPIKIPNHLLKNTYTFEFDDKMLGEKQLEKMEADWEKIQEQSPALAAAIEAGQIAITVNGYASTPGKPAYNIDLANTRAFTSMMALRGFIGDKAMFFPIGRGAQTAKVSGAARQEQRVEVIIDAAGAKLALENQAKQAAQ